MARFPYLFVIFILFGLILAENSRVNECPEGQYLDCSEVCWPEWYFQPGNNYCEDGHGLEENSNYPNFSCLDWGSTVQFVTVVGWVF